MHQYIATLLIGLSPKEQSIVLLLFHLAQNSFWGEVPGRNFRTLLELTKDNLFLELEKLVQKNILKFSTERIANTVYISAGKGYYIFYPATTEWLPTSESLFYKVCKLLGYPFNKHSYITILKELDLREELNKDPEVKEKRMTPFELFDIFCQWHVKLFGREYAPPNQVKDLQTLKKIIFDMSFEGYSEESIKDFLKWSFLSKARTFNSSFIVGFLPLCLRDYLATNKIAKVYPNYKKDDDGRIRYEKGTNI